MQITPTVNEEICDTNWNRLPRDSLLTTRYIFMLASGAICWKWKKQQIIKIHNRSWVNYFNFCYSVVAIGTVNNQYYNGKWRALRRKYTIVEAYDGN